MKQLIIISLFALTSVALFAQKYPEPEFANEICFLNKDSINSIIRLEKSMASMETKTKILGIGGTENGYEMTGERSKVRLHGGRDFSFVYSTGSSVSNNGLSSRQSDSVMRANGMDPSTMKDMNSMGGMGMDPAQMISLYKAESGKGKRKVVTMKMGYGYKKPTSSDKYTFSVRKVRDGYWELVIDKPLPKGEYAFQVTGYGGNGMDGSTVMYTFAVD